MSTATTVRISKQSKHVLDELAKYYKTPLQKTLEKIVQEHKKRVFFDKVDFAYDKLQKDSKEWDKEKEERNIWNNTLLDNQTE